MNYGCINCQYLNEEYECNIPIKYIYHTNNELQDIITKCLGKGEIWKNKNNPICPYYKEKK